MSIEYFDFVFLGKISVIHIISGDINDIRTSNRLSLDLVKTSILV